MGLTVRDGTIFEAEVLAALHTAAFLPLGERPWSVEEMAALIRMPGAFALMALENQEPIGALLARAAADEAELLTLAVPPQKARRGAGGALIDEALRRLEGAGVGVFILEVAWDNHPARALYQKKGFSRTGTRPHYYKRTDGSTMDALVLSRRIGSLQD